MFSRIPNIRIHDFFDEFFVVFFETRWSFLLRSKMLLKLCVFVKEDTLQLLGKKYIFCEKKSWILRFGIRDNMSHAVLTLDTAISASEWIKQLFSNRSFYWNSFSCFFFLQKSWIRKRRIRQVCNGVGRRRSWTSNPRRIFLTSAQKLLWQEEVFLLHHFCGSYRVSFITPKSQFCVIWGSSVWNRFKTACIL